MKYELDRLLKPFELSAMPSAARPYPVHYLLIIFHTASVSIPGDQRSRECPGHGYPAHTENYRDNRVFGFSAEENEKNVWQEAVRQLFEEDPKRQDVIAVELERLLHPVVKVALGL